MSEQALDLRKALQLVWRRRRLVAIFVAVGLLLGAAYTAVSPPVPAGQALVILPSNIKDLQTQVVVATSDQVLQSAQQSVDRSLSLEALRKKVTAKSLTSNVISITATGPSAGAAENLANSVAQSYINLVGSANGPGGPLQARMLQSAATATQTPLVVQLLENEAFGILAGLLIGAIIALARSRGDKRLRDRDEIADSIGVPVLASMPVAHPSDAAAWTRLLEEYEPAVVHAWRLRSMLRELGLTGAGLTGADTPAAGDGLSLAVLSLTGDPRALALGPQLAVFAASLGFRTALLVTPHPDGDISVALQTAAAAAAGPGRSAQLQVAVGDRLGDDRGPVALTVVVAVVDDAKPQVADLSPTAVTLLGVSAATVTAAQLARVAVSTADVGRQVTGVLVADPLTGDRTTGRLPQLARPARSQQPTRLTGTKTGAGARR
jgi:capsular polysaccharide biosynthesis protein